MPGNIPWTEQELFTLATILFDLSDGTNRVYSQDVKATGRLDRSVSGIYNKMLRFKKAFYKCWRENDGKPTTQVNKLRSMLDRAGFDLGGQIFLSLNDIIPIPPKGTRDNTYADVRIPDDLSNGSVLFPLKYPKPTKPQNEEEMLRWLYNNRHLMNDLLEFSSYWTGERRKGAVIGMTTQPYAMTTKQKNLVRGVFNEAYSDS